MLVTEISGKRLDPEKSFFDSNKISLNQTKGLARFLCKNGPQPKWDLVSSIRRHWMSYRWLGKFRFLHFLPQLIVRKIWKNSQHLGSSRGTSVKFSRIFARKIFKEKNCKNCCMQFFRWKNLRTKLSLLSIICLLKTRMFSNFFIKKIACTNFCNFFLCEFYAQKFAKNLQKFLLIKLNYVNFFKFSQLISWGEKCKNEICLYGGYRAENLHKIILGQMPSYTWY